MVSKSPRSCRAVTANRRIGSPTDYLARVFSSSTFLLGGTTGSSTDNLLDSSRGFILCGIGNLPA